MSLVNVLRFSRSEGAMISDEEYLLHRRRTFFQDNIQSLLPDEVADATGVELIYGGTGDPYFHYDVVTKSRKRLIELMGKGNVIRGKDSPVYEASKEVLKIVQGVTRNWVEQKLQFLFGFGVDDFTRGYYLKEGKKYSIEQECVRKKALNLIGWGDKNELMKPLFESRALILGCDPEEGVQVFYVNVENQVLSFNSGDYDSIGAGVYGAGQTFATYMQRKHMQKRLLGFPRVEAMVMLIESASTAAQTYRSIGGYFNILYLDGNQKNRQGRIKTVTEERSKLAFEVVSAFKKGLIPAKACHTLVDNLVFQDMPVDEADEMFFQKAKNSETLELFLRGYKIDLPTEWVEGSPLPNLDDKNTNDSKKEEKKRKQS